MGWMSSTRTMYVIQMSTAIPHGSESFLCHINYHIGVISVLDFMQPTRSRIHQDLLITLQRMTEAVIVGGGLIGSLLAVMLAKRGYSVDLYERFNDPRKVSAAEGRSINLVLTTRGLRALHRVGLSDVMKLCVPVKGRMMHSVEGELTYQPYGQENQWNNSISRW